MDFPREARDNRGGGVTLGGGETTIQSEAALSLLSICKQNGVNTAVETSGYVKTGTLLRLAEFTDLFLFDIKHFLAEEHRRFTGVGNELILENCGELLANRYNVRIRMPLLEGINTGEEAIRGISEFLAPYADYRNFKGIDLLPYHKLGKNKYKQLGLEYRLEGDPVVSEETLKAIQARFRAKGLETAIIRH